jgi:hypothetical protein
MGCVPKKEVVVVSSEPLKPARKINTQDIDNQAKPIKIEQGGKNPILENKTINNLPEVISVSFKNRFRNF